MNIESKLWKLIRYNDAHVNIIQKASGVLRVVSSEHVPHVDALAAMNELRFNRVCREAFHGER